MRDRVLNHIVFFVFFLVNFSEGVCAVGGTPEVSTQRLIAKAFSFKKNDLLYLEKHELKYQGAYLIESVTEYLDPDNTVIAVIKSNYRSSQSLPEYSFVDMRSGFVEGLRKVDGQYFAYYQEKGKKEEIKILSDTKDVFSGQAWNHFILSNLETIDEKGVKFSLLIPSRLDTYRFSLKKKKKENGQIHFSLKFSNFFLRLIAPELLLFYDAQKKYLRSYIGPSNLKDKNGDSPKVKIIYEQAR